MRPRSAETSEPAWEKREDVVDEQQGVGAGLIAKVLGHGQRRQRHAKTGARRLVHLTEHHHRLIDDALAGVADLGLLHLEPEVVALTGTLADAGEAGVTRVEAGQASDQLLDDHGLADAGTAPERPSGHPSQTTTSSACLRPADAPDKVGI